VQLSPFARRIISTLTGLVVLFLWAPLVYAALLAFNTERSTILQGLSLKWWGPTFRDEEVREALWGSVKTALVATLIALVLGTLLAFALQRFNFFGKSVLSFVVVLPIALPGILTGIALNSAFRSLGRPLGFTSLVVAHATFCIVVVHNNVLARLRRLPASLEEASADLGADTFQTLRHVTFPVLASSLSAGAILAFALSFDEIVVTTFTAGAGFNTLPQYILSNFSRPNNLPKVNVAVLVVLLLSIVPVWFAQKLSESGPGMASNSK
jgi:putative spermidine/putrescine transport system permease protein